MSEPATALALQQAIAELARERQRTTALQQRLLSLSEELEVVKGAAFNASNSRLLAEEELDDTRDRLQLALDAAQLALWEWHIPTGDVFLNARWGEMLGDIAMDTHEQVARLLARIHPEDLAGLQHALNAAVSGQAPQYSVQYRIRTLDDTWLWLESHGMAAERDEAGRALRLIGVAADIQERKRSQAEAESARQLAEVANRTKTEFLANISHEVRTPLNGVMGLIRLLMDSPLSSDQRHWLTLMDDSAHTLLGLLNDVLDLSKIEAGKMSVETTPFDVADVVEQTCAPLVAQATLKPLQVDIHIHPGLSGMAQGDPGKLRQVLTNLLSNAVKFTPAHGRIRVAARPADSGSGITFEVADTGIGIAPENQSRVFEAFTQADASTTRQFGGTGLGLAITARLVDMMGGAISLVSAPGQGSTFAFTLPLQMQAAASSRSSAPGNLPSAPMELEHLQSKGRAFDGLRVLVAEDHPINELLMCKLLDKLGCHTTVARDGQQALAAWQRGGIDLIMMDVQMPELNGLDATTEIRRLERLGRRPPTCPQLHTPIVAVTANAMAGDEAVCLSAGMDTYTSKPVSPQALMEAMAQALDISARWGPATEAVPATPATVNMLPRQPHASPRSPALSMDTLLRRLDGNHEALRQLSIAMRAEIAEHAQALKQAHSQHDGAAAAQRARALKGVLASITAQRAAALANGLELAARSGEWPLFGRALPVLVSELAKIEQALAATDDGALRPH